MFTCIIVVDETRNRKSTKGWIVEIDADQIHPYSMCRPMLTGLHTKNNFGAEVQ